jgi:hypothetical protein
MSLAVWRGECPPMTPTRGQMLSYSVQPMVRASVSHISEDKETAGRIKSVLTRDFLGLLDVFLSSDTQSIAAGEEWLESNRASSSRVGLIDGAL